MKRVKVNFNFKSMALVLFALVLSSNVWGADVTFDLTKTTQITTQTASSVVFTSGVATLSISQGSGGTAVNNYMPGGSTSATHTRTYQKNPITFNAGSGKKLASVTITVTSSSGAIAQITNGTWSAEVTTSGSSPTITYTLKTAAQSITVTPAGTSRIEKVEYTYAASKTLSSITVKTDPSKVTYTEGDKFDPTGLVITKNYSDGSTEDWTYASHESDFTFSPSTSTALTTSNKSVTITVGGKSTTQSITVNAKPKYTVTFYNAGEVVKTVSNVVEGTLFSAIKPTIGTGSGQLNIESCDNNSTHFMGWTKEESFQKRGSAPPYVADGTAINSNMELRAVWAAEQ